MNKVLIILVILILLGGGGFFIYKNYFGSGSKTVSNSSEPAKNETLLCDIQRQTCSGNSKTSNSGSLKISVVSGSDTVNNLEVDLGAKPGAPQYYLKMTDESGVALFEGIPAGSYVIYFNQENFPSGLVQPALETVSVAADQTTQTSINLSK